MTLEVDRQSFKHVRVHLPMVAYVNWTLPYSDYYNITQASRSKNTRSIMPFIPIANQAIRSRLAKFQNNRSESSVDISWLTHRQTTTDYYYRQTTESCHHIVPGGESARDKKLWSFLSPPQPWLIFAEIVEKGKNPKLSEIQFLSLYGP